HFSSCRNEVLAEGLMEIRGSRIGLVGFGNIARQVAKIALFLGASVSYCATRRQPSEVESQFPVAFKPLDELLATSDVVSLHVPHSNRTRGMLGARELALMPPGSLLVNTARGEIVDQEALAAALESGHLAGAAIDTFAPEPPQPGNPLLNLSAAANRRLLATPHTAGVTIGSYRRMLESAFANMARVLRGEMPQNVVNGVFVRKA
ncbi:MAG TPA: NAD(P)-dependent oxidoreductase, partial [Negativicutes bacterium]|nr:NAD(P)-dependent oxidoreductase [Negativicutes bacterium]